MLKVVLLAHTPLPEKLVAAAAKNCYSPSGIDNPYSKQTDEQAADFVDMLAAIGHESPIEHAVFTFGVEGVSRVLLAQLTRHRIASYSVKSQRYVSEADFQYITPPEIEAIPEAKARYLKAMEQSAAAYGELYAILKQSHVKNLISQGIDQKAAEKSADKSAMEDARYVLPNACETKIVFTMNARSLRNFFKQRCCMRAQWEIRDMADKMLQEVKKVAPALFRAAGPGCVTGPCPEGKMSCGNAQSVREKYRSIGVGSDEG